MIQNSTGCGCGIFLPSFCLCLLFLLGMLIIGSTYQHLRSPWGLPSLWAAVSSQHPVKLASRDLPNNEMMMVSSDPPRASSEMEGDTLVPQATVGRGESTVENTPNPPRRTANITPTIPKNNYSPTEAEDLYYFFPRPGIFL